MFIDGYLALCSAVGAGSATELTGVAGYVRQPIAFGEPVDGVAFSTVPYSFGIATRWAAAIGQPNYPAPLGRAIYDAPTGGNLLLVLPHPLPLAAARLPWDAGDIGHLRLFFADLAGFRRGGAYTGRIAAGATMGACNDAYDVTNWNDLTQVLGQTRPLINTGVLTAGVALSIHRGILEAAAMVPAASE